MTRETEVADYLRADAALRALAKGGIYPSAILPETGLTNAKTMTKVWAGGKFNTTMVVRQRASVPTGDLQDTLHQHTSVSQVIEVWVYAKEEDDLEAALNRVYTLLMGHRLVWAFSATLAGSGLGMGQAPELPAGIKTQREDYRIVFIRARVAV